MLLNKMIDSFKVNESISNILFLLRPEIVTSDLKYCNSQYIGTAKG